MITFTIKTQTAMCPLKLDLASSQVVLGNRFNLLLLLFISLNTVLPGQLSKSQKPTPLPFEATVSEFNYQPFIKMAIVKLDNNELWQIIEEKPPALASGVQVKIYQEGKTRYFELSKNERYEAIRVHPRTLAEVFGEDEAKKMKRDREYQENAAQIRTEEAEIVPGERSFISQMFRPSRIDFDSTAAGFYNFALSEKLKTLEIEKLRRDNAGRKERDDQKDNSAIIAPQFNTFGKPAPERSPVEQELSEKSVLETIDEYTKRANQQAKKWTDITFLNPLKKEGELASYSWSKVQENLGPQDVAIEFLKFRMNKKNEWDKNYHYYALVVTKSFTTPKKLYLGQAQSIENVMAALTDQNANKFYLHGKDSPQKSWAGFMYNFCWRPVDQVLSSLPATGKIYFSPAGVLGRVSFAALVDEQGIPLIKKFNLVQVNTTRDIGSKVSTLRPPKNDCWLLAAGIDYETPAVVPVNPHDAPCELVMDGPKTRTKDSLYTDRYLPLPEHAEVVDSISDLLSKVSIPHRVMKENGAAEDYFKLLGYNRPSPPVIHLATHGFSVIEKDNNYDKAVDYSLKKSGLILSGYGYIYSRNRGEHDGQWTTEEIAQQDLSNTQLVVLSACNSGKGASGLREGIYGIQRGLKLAGVKNIIVAQWNVRDDAGAFFWKGFYRRWLSGSSIEQAFKDTQLSMMETEKYKRPFYWAVFQLIQ